MSIPAMTLTVRGPNQLSLSLNLTARPIMNMAVSRAVVLHVEGAAGAGAQTIISPVAVSANRLLAWVGDQLVYYNPALLTHLYALVGMSTNAANVGEPLTIIREGEVENIGWGLVPDALYYATGNGQITNQFPASNAFSQVVGRAKNANTLLFSPNNTYVNG